MAARRWEGDDAQTTAFTARRGASDAGDAQDRDDADQPQDNDASTTPQKPAPTKRKRNLLNESHLLSKDGFKKIHRTFPYQTSSSIVPGQEAKALNSLIRMYKQWAYDLYPGLNFEDFIDRTEALGRQHGVQGLMSDLRSKESRRALGLPEDESFASTASTGGDGNDENEEEEEARHASEPDPEESGFIVAGGDEEDDGDDSYSEEEAML